MKYKIDISPSKTWKLLDSKVVLDNEWYKIRKDEVQLPNGTIIKDYYVSELQNVSMIFAITQENKVIFVKQYRHPVKDVLLNCQQEYIQRRSFQLTLPKRTLRRNRL